MSPPTWTLETTHYYFSSISAFAFILFLLIFSISSIVSLWMSHLSSSRWTEMVFLIPSGFSSASPVLLCCSGYFGSIWGLCLHVHRCLYFECIAANLSYSICLYLKYGMSMRVEVQEGAVPWAHARAWTSVFDTFMSVWYYACVLAHTSWVCTVPPCLCAQMHAYMLAYVHQ